MTISKTSVSGYTAAIFGLLTIMATVPTELQKMIMEQVPKGVQPWIAIIFAVAAFIARSYQGHVTQDKLASTPAETTQTTLTTQTTATVAPEPTIPPATPPTP